MDIIQIIKYFLNFLNYKINEVLFGFSISLLFTSIINIIGKHIISNELEMPIILLTILGIISGIFIMVDLIFGILVSKKDNIKISSDGFSKTVAKFTAIVLYFILALFAIFIHKNLFVFSIVYTPLILSILKEYISIGENLYKITGTKYYIFTLIDNLFDILELRFINTLKNKEDNILSSINKEKEDEYNQ